MNLWNTLKSKQEEQKSQTKKENEA